MGGEKVDQAVLRSTPPSREATFQNLHLPPGFGGLRSTPPSREATAHWTSWPIFN